MKTLRPIRTGTAELRVRYEETDRAGVVYHANYLRYFEVGRTELMRSLGACYRKLEASGTLLTVVEAELSYLRPAHYDDQLRIETELVELTGARLRFVYRIIDVASERLLCTGSTRLGCLRADQGRPTRLPDVLRKLLVG